jgi:large subunit ribosomal protein L17
MRHRKQGRQLRRTSEQRLALLRNLATSLIENGAIVTTEAKAKELRPFVEKIITIAKRGVKAADPKGKTLAAKRQVAEDVHNPEVVAKLFDSLAPRFAERPGGYTRILKLGARRGDAAEVALIELVGSEFDPKKAEAERKAAEEAAQGGDGAKTQKSVGERLRAAASRLRGTKKEKGDGGAKPKANRPGRGAAKKATTPRKAGGS